MQLQRKSPQTIKAYVSGVAHLASHYGRSPDEISLEEIREYFHWLIVERKLASSSCNQKLAAIRWFYKTVLRQSLDLRVPMKRSGRLPEPLSHQEIDRLFQAVNNIKHRALLMTAYGGGLRVSELVRLRVDDIHSDRMLILVRRGKGDKDRYTALSHRLLQELRVYWMQYRPGPWLFPGPNPDVPLTASTAQRAFYRAKTRAGIRHGRGIHSLRHSFATHLLEGGTRLPLIQRLLGHSTFTTTTRYLHVTQKHLGCVKSPLDLLRMPSEDELE